MSFFSIIIISVFYMKSTFGFAQNGNQIDYPQIGLSFKLPTGWVGQESNGMYVMGHNSIPGMIFIIPHSKPMSTAEMVNESSNGLQFADGTAFRPVNSLTKFDEHTMGGEFDGTFEYTPAKAFIIGMTNPKGNGITIVAVTSADAYNLQTYKSLAFDVKSNVVFSKLQAINATNNAAASGTLKDWKYQLGDTKLTFMESYSSGGENGGGYNMKEEIHLCKVGYFLYYGQNFVSAGGDNSSIYSGGNSRGHGNWQITNRSGSFILLLSFNDGNSKEYKLTWGGDKKLFLNGYRYYRTWEGDYAPDCFR
jgi:hypothetical protein